MPTRSQDCFALLTALSALLVGCGLSAPTADSPIDVGGQELPHGSDAGFLARSSAGPLAVRAGEERLTVELASGQAFPVELQAWGRTDRLAPAIRPASVRATCHPDPASERCTDRWE